MMMTTMRHHHDEHHPRRPLGFTIVPAGRSVSLLSPPASFCFFVCFLHSPSAFTLSINSLHDGVVVLLVLVVVLLLFLVVVVAVVEVVLLFHCIIFSRLHSSDASNLVNS